jgi:hypothetical protein
MSDGLEWAKEERYGSYLAKRKIKGGTRCSRGHEVMKQHANKSNGVQIGQ